MASGLDETPTSMAPDGTCPRCGTHAHFTKVADHVLQLDDSGDAREQVVILRCAACDTSIISIEHHSEDGDWQGQHWWPTPGLGALSNSVPDQIVSAYDEGIRAISVSAPRAAAVMFRAALAEVIEDKGSASAKSKRTLDSKLRQMSDEGTLHPSISDWAGEIRILGNAGGHPEDKSVTVEESRELAQLTRQLLELIYEVPARIARARSARTPKAEELPGGGM
jgi:hypothetical protein